MNQNSPGDAAYDDQEQNKATPISHTDDGHLQYLLTAYLFENLSEAGQAEVDGHLTECAVCRQELDEMRATFALLEDSLLNEGDGDEAGAPYSFEARRIQRIMESSRKSKFWLGTLPKRLSIAACLLFGVVLAVGLLNGLNSGSREGYAPQFAMDMSTSDSVVEKSEMMPTESATKDHYSPSAKRNMDKVPEILGNSESDVQYSYSIRTRDAEKKNAPEEAKARELLEKVSESYHSEPAKKSRDFADFKKIEAVMTEEQKREAANSWADKRSSKSSRRKSKQAARQGREFFSVPTDGKSKKKPGSLSPKAAENPSINLVHKAADAKKKEITADSLSLAEEKFALDENISNYTYRHEAKSKAPVTSIVRKNDLGLSAPTQKTPNPSKITPMRGEAAGAYSSRGARARMTRGSDDARKSPNQRPKLKSIKSNKQAELAGEEAKRSRLNYDDAAPKLDAAGGGGGGNNIDMERGLRDSATASNEALRPLGGLAGQTATGKPSNDSANFSNIKSAEIYDRDFSDELDGIAAVSDQPATASRDRGRRGIQPTQGQSGKNWGDDDDDIATVESIDATRRSNQLGETQQFTPPPTSNGISSNLSLSFDTDRYEGDQNIESFDMHFSTEDLKGDSAGITAGYVAGPDASYSDSPNSSGRGTRREMAKKSQQAGNRSKPGRSLKQSSLKDAQAQIEQLKKEIALGMQSKPKASMPSSGSLEGKKLTLGGRELDPNSPPEGLGNDLALIKKRNPDFVLDDQEDSEEEELAESVEFYGKESSGRRSNRDTKKVLVDSFGVAPTHELESARERVAGQTAATEDRLEVLGESRKGKAVDKRAVRKMTLATIPEELESQRQYRRDLEKRAAQLADSSNSSANEFLERRQQRIEERQKADLQRAYGGIEYNLSVSRKEENNQSNRLEVEPLAKGEFSRFSFADPSNTNEAFIDLPRDHAYKAQGPQPGSSTLDKPLLEQIANSAKVARIVQAAPINSNLQGEKLQRKSSYAQSDEHAQFTYLESSLRAAAHMQQQDESITPTQLLEQAKIGHKRLIPGPIIGDEGLGRDGFRARYGVNPFISTRVDAQSTFAMDVDTASYTRAQSQIASGILPDPKDVRIEEFVNAFSFEQEVDPIAAFSAYCDGAPAYFSDEGLETIRLSVKARDLEAHERKPVCLTFAVDSSGSMQLGARIELVRDALTELLDNLQPEDQVALISYGSQAYLALPHTPARERDQILGALESLSASGNTNVESGLSLAYRIADESYQEGSMNRVILCSDGVATEGARTAEDILQRVKLFASRDIYLSVVGFGKQRYNDNFLEELANNGNGNYSYVDSLTDAKRIFEEGLPASLQVLAQNAKIQMEFNPETVDSYRLLGYENRDIKDKDFRNDKVDAGEVGPGTTVTVLYEIKRRPHAHASLGTLQLRYFDTSLQQIQELQFPLAGGLIQPTQESSSSQLRFLSCVAETAELLRQSYWSKNGSFSEVLDQLSELDPSFLQRAEVAEFVQLVKKARELTIASLLTKVQGEIHDR